MKMYEVFVYLSKYMVYIGKILELDLSLDLNFSVEVVHESRPKSARRVPLFADVC